MATTSATAAGGDAASTGRDSFIPLFTGQPTDYKEWRKRISLYHQKMVLSKRAGESVLNIVGSLTGSAWRLVEDFDIAHAEKETAFADILKLLDKHFQYDDRVQLPSDFDAYFGLSRRQGQTLLSYVSDHEDQLKKLDRHGVKLPETVQGWHLLRKCNLSREQRQLVNMRAPTLEKVKVIEALYLILGQDHKASIQPDRRHFGKSKGRGYVVADEEAHYQDDFDDAGDWPSEDGYYEIDETYGMNDDWFPGDPDFDLEAIYYQHGDDDGVTVDGSDSPWVEEFDQVYAAHLDARKRFSDLRLSRGFFPVVAIGDPSAGNLSPGVLSPPGSPSSKGGKGKTKKGKGKGGKFPSANFKFNKYPAKSADPRGRAKTLTCLRCGQPGHFAAQCPVKSSSSSTGGGNKRPAPGPTESMVRLEDAHVTFMDQHGHERHDVTMLDPGASAFLCGYGPLRRYLDYLKACNFPVETIEFNRCCRKFCFGGDGESWSHWVVRLPMCLGGLCGRAQVFLIKGETPMLCGRPIIEALGIVLDFANKKIRFQDGPWTPATLGYHGEYLMPLWEQVDEDYPHYNPDLLQFDLMLAGDGEVDPKAVTLEQFDGEEHIFTSADVESPSARPADDSRLLPRHQLQTIDLKLQEAHTEYHSYVTNHLHNKKKVIWEVYCGNARTSEMADCMGAHVEIFSYETGWDFDLKTHRNEFLRRLKQEVPDELFLAPTCGPWSTMQNLAARTPEQRAHLQETREWHHEIHLNFVKVSYLCQVRNGAHAHLEQPAFALSWKTRALRDLPGFYAVFDQCQYGAQCLDSDGVWKPVKKTTCIQTTKHYLFKELNLRCPGDHQHCPLEGSAPGLGRRTQFVEDYQPGLSSVIAACLVFDEVPMVADFVGAVNEDREAMSGIIQLLTNNKPEAVRTVQRLHRNLGHPDPQQLTELLSSRGASDVVLEAARRYHCVACQRYKKPNKASPAQLPTADSFNQVIQADVLWIKLGSKKYPILSVVDTATKFQAASVLYGERTSDFLHALERGWIRHFGCPTTLITDEGRGWASDEMLTWTSDVNIQHMISPGEAHTRLGIVERRHAVLRKAVEIYMNDLGLQTVDGLRQALAYVLPQVNSTPSVAGFSPAQWVIGYQPAFPGDLLAEGLNPSHLGGNLSFEKVLEKRSTAKQALVKADTDQRLRRALLRRYAGSNTLLEPGQACFYWRDARHADLVKIRWLGPATIILREDDPSTGKPHLYWIAHGTQLLRCAPHHVRADFRTADTVIGGLVEARRLVSQLKSRGVTRYLDLERVNKRNIEDVDEDEEADGEEETGDIPQPPLRRQRLDDLPSMDFDLGDDEHLPEPPDDTYSPSYAPVPEQAEDVVIPDDPLNEDLDTIPTEPGEETPLNSNETEPGLEPSIPPSVPDSPGSTTRSRSQRGEAAPVPSLDPALASLYEPATAEDFASRRLRFDRQETMSYGPQRVRSSTVVPPQPYVPQVPSTSTPSESTESFSQAFSVEDVDLDALPHGWTVDEDGYFQLTDRPVDFWEVRAGCLVRHHLRPRFVLYQVKKNPDLDIPIEPQFLDSLRVTVAKFSDGKVEIVTDDGTSQKAYPKTWVGMTIYQISGAARKELCMHASLPAKKIAKDFRGKFNRVQKKVDKGGISERHLSLDEKLQFQNAKQKELRSFFENQVWQFDTAANADPSRTMTARMLLKWSKNEDGSPRAKARLIVRGYADVDALQGSLETSSPTTTRLSRSFLLSLTSMLGWKLWTSDIATAFLQGLPQERKLWVKLPSECLRLLGAPDETRMLLVKPVYGQLDAPRRWYLEAVRRLRSLGLRQHLLDPCTFLIYETDLEDPYKPGTCRSSTLGDDRLCGMICLHVDDMLGAGDADSPVYQEVIKKLREMFSFREWKDGDNLEYCGATIEKGSDGTLKLNHSSYLKKVKPLTLGKHLGPESELSSQEVTALRGLLGALQWPAVQSSPHLQASTSIYSGSVSRGLVKTALEANRLLKFAKENSDVGLVYAPLDLGEMRIVTAFDASFGCRPDGSSQGGFVVMLAPKKILETEEDFYHILDWRSLKLPRIARSSLAAEAQAAACASDATEFACRYFEHLRSPTVPLGDLLKLRSSLDPVLITDAKALFDSYHRESLVSSVTDRRISLEIRVVKEQMESLGGSLRWVSSERQLADGLTKDTARQLFADRLRHAKVKFLFDPDYVAAKKKPLAERLQSQGEGSKSRKNKKTKRTSTLDTIVEKEEKNFDENEVPESEDFLEETEVLQNAEVNGDGIYMALSDGPLHYVNVINLVAPEVGGSHFGFLVTLVAFLLTIGCYVAGYVHGRRSRDAVPNVALERLEASERQSGAFAVVMPLLERALARAHERVHEADPDNRRALNDRLREEMRLLRAQWADLMTLRTHANRVVQRALDESTWHSDEECPFGKTCYVSMEDRTWHMSWTCSAEHYHTEAHRCNACRICASEWHTPWVPNDRTGVSLHTDLEHFLEESAQVNFESEEEEEDHLSRVRRYQNMPLGEASDPEFWQQINHHDGGSSSEDDGADGAA